VLRLLLTPRWLVRHLLLAVALVVCWLFARWQYGRAVDRHSVLNWSYTIEWTLFGAFAVLCWGWFLRDELRGPQEEPEQVAPKQRVVTPVSDEDDPELAAYNRMLARLHEKDTA
jgi:type VI protein secretion system component VasK